MVVFAVLISIVTWISHMQIFFDRILDLHNRMGMHLLRFTLLAWKQKTFLVCVSAQHQNSATLSPGLYYLAVQ